MLSDIILPKSDLLDVVILSIFIEKYNVLLFFNEFLFICFLYAINWQLLVCLSRGCSWIILTILYIVSKYSLLIECYKYKVKSIFIYLFFR